MRILRLFVLSLVTLYVLFCFGDARAQQVPPSAPSTAAASLVQQALRTLSGGFPVNDITLTGTARRIDGSEDETGAVTARALATGQSRIDLNLPSGTRSEVRTSGNSSNTNSARVAPSATTLIVGRGGAWSGPDGVSHVEADHNLLTDSSWFFPSLMMARIASTNDFALVDAGPETKQGRQVEHLVISRQSPSGTPLILSMAMQHLSRTDIFLDASTMLPVAVDFSTHPDNNASLDIPVEILFSDYRALNSGQVAFHVQKYENGTLALDLRFENAVPNSGVSSDVFQIPNGAQP